MKYLSPVLAALLLIACDSATGPNQDQKGTDAGDGGVHRELIDAGGSGGGGGGGGGDCTPTGDETCNGVDDNCDGHIDEGFGIGAPCAAGMGVCAAEGKLTCAADGSTTTCDAEPGEPGEDVCDGKDNDCDGEADEDFDLDTDPENCGECGRACGYDHAGGICDQRECLMGDCAAGWGDANGMAVDGCECEMRNDGVEACNGLDDNCDGDVDEGFDLGGVCSSGEGACAVEGVFECGDDGLARCSASPAQPGDEVCNGLDDDCDGDVDEGFDADEDGATFCPDLDCDGPCPEGFDCASACENRDCDDDDPAINPSARDICEDGIDQNCDGRDAPCQVPVGRANAVQIASDVQIGCGDFDDDGRVDNAFAGLGGLANDQLQASIDDDSLNILPATIGLSPPGRDGRFDLAILTGVPSLVQPGAYDLDPQSVDEDGQSRVLFANAVVAAGAMLAGPGDFALSIPVPAGGGMFDLEVSQTSISGDLSVDDQGVTLDDGIIAGLVTEEALQRAVALLPPEVALLLPVLLTPDIDLDGDGRDDAYSVCLTFAAVPATLLGFPVP